MIRWVLTQSGQVVDLSRPEAGTIMQADIAHGLAITPAVGGQTHRPYSMAEHATLVYEVMERTFAADAHGRLAALLHYAPAAYTGALAVGAWAEAGQETRDMMERMRRTVRSAYGLHTAAHEWAPWIRQAEAYTLATVRAQLMAPGGPPWPDTAMLQPIGWLDLMAPERAAMSWQEWRQHWADCVDAMDYARNIGRFPVAQP